MYHNTKVSLVPTIHSQQTNTLQPYQTYHILQFCYFTLKSYSIVNLDTKVSEFIVHKTNNGAAASVIVTLKFLNILSRFNLTKEAKLNYYSYGFLFERFSPFMFLHSTNISTNPEI